MEKRETSSGIVSQEQNEAVITKAVSKSTKELRHE